MKLHHVILAGLSTVALAGTASAQSTTATSPAIAVRGNVPPLCSGGTLAAANGTAFELGVLIDTATGFLKSGLTAPSKTLSGAFCSSRSAITVAATPMTAQNFTATAPTGFSRTVNYNATASGWTATPATVSTGAASNPNATQQRATAFTGDITVAVDSFTTAGGNGLRMVADTNYQGTVTVTLAVVS